MYREKYNPILASKKTIIDVNRQTIRFVYKK